MIYTTLNEIQSFGPCEDGWNRVLASQGKTAADDVLFPLTEALTHCTIGDVCWLLGRRKTEIQVAVRFARMCADSVQHLKTATGAADRAADRAAAEAAAEAAEAADRAAAEAARAARAAEAADWAADWAARDAAAAAAQNQRNKEFLARCITEWSAE